MLLAAPKKSIFAPYYRLLPPGRRDPHVHVRLDWPGTTSKVKSVSRSNQSSLSVLDNVFRKLSLYVIALLRFWSMLYKRKRSPWSPKMVVEEVRLREELGPESTSRVAIPASSAPQRALAPALITASMVATLEMLAVDEMPL